MATPLFAYLFDSLPTSRRSHASIKERLDFMYDTENIMRIYAPNDTYDPAIRDEHEHLMIYIIGRIRQLEAAYTDETVDQTKPF